MTEGMMSPERQGWFAGVKDKLRKSFTVEGSKENFYKKNADLISKATANLSPEDKQAAYAQIEQDALTSAKIDVATHWGAAVVGTTAATLGVGMLNEKFRKVIEQRGGAFGKTMATKGRDAENWLRKVIRFPRLHGSSTSAVGRGTLTETQWKAMNARSNKLYDAGNIGVGAKSMPENPLARLKFRVENNLAVLGRAKDKVNVQQQLDANGKLLGVIRLAEADKLPDKTLQAKIRSIADRIVNAQDKLKRITPELKLSHTPTELDGYKQGIKRMEAIIAAGDKALKEAALKAVK